MRFSAPEDWWLVKTCVSATVIAKSSSLFHPTHLKIKNRDIAVFPGETEQFQLRGCRTDALHYSQDT